AAWRWPVGLRGGPPPSARARHRRRSRAATRHTRRRDGFGKGFRSTFFTSDRMSVANTVVRMAGRPSIRLGLMVGTVRAGPGPVTALRFGERARSSRLGEPRADGLGVVLPSQRGVDGAAGLRLG